VPTSAAPAKGFCFVPGKFEVFPPFSLSCPALPDDLEVFPPPTWIRLLFSLSFFFEPSVACFSLHEKLEEPQPICLLLLPVLCPAKNHRLHDVPPPFCPRIHVNRLPFLNCLQPLFFISLLVDHLSSPPSTLQRLLKSTLPSVAEVIPIPPSSPLRFPSAPSPLSQICSRIPPPPSQQPNLPLCSYNPRWRVLPPPLFFLKQQTASPCPKPHILPGNPPFPRLNLPLSSGSVFFPSLDVIYLVKCFLYLFSSPPFFF